MDEKQFSQIFHNMMNIGNMMNAPRDNITIQEFFIS